MEQGFELIRKRFYAGGISDVSAWQDSLVAALVGVPMWAATLVITKYMCLLAMHDMSVELATVENWIIPKQNYEESKH